MQSTIPSTVGVMVLPGAVLFPGALLPLRIFEPRYRSMLADAVAGSRMFAVAMERSQGASTHDIGGLGVIRACVTAPDGTSCLVLRGLDRVRFAAWYTDHPYPWAHVQPLESCIHDSDEVARLSLEVRDFCLYLRQKGVDFPDHLFDSFETVENPCELSDLVASTVVTSAAVRQKLLKDLDVSSRLRTLITYLARLCLN